MVSVTPARQLPRILAFWAWNSASVSTPSARSLARRSSSTVVEATTADARTVTGRAVGLDDFGALRLSTDSGEVKVGFGEIRHLGQRA